MSVPITAFGVPFQKALKLSSLSARLWAPVGLNDKVSDGGGRMLRVIVVVARDRADLFSYFEKVFEGMPDIRVLLDRRLAPPTDTAAAAPDHPLRERRDVYDELQERGFVMIRLW